jgi:hypothetical protein
MRNHFKWAVGLAGAIAIVAVSVPAHAVKTNVDGYFYDLAEGATKKP